MAPPQVLADHRRAREFVHARTSTEFAETLTYEAVMVPSDLTVRAVRRAGVAGRRWQVAGGILSPASAGGGTKVNDDADRS